MKSLTFTLGLCVGLLFLVAALREPPETVDANIITAEQPSPAHDVSPNLGEAMQLDEDGDDSPDACLHGAAYDIMSQAEPRIATSCLRAPAQHEPRSILKPPRHS